MAAELVSLNDVVVPVIFNPYVQKLTEEKTAFLASGIVQRVPQLDQFLAGGGMSMTIPTWKDLDNDAPRIAQDGTASSPWPYTDAGVILGGNVLIPNKIQTYSEVVVRCTRNQSWGANRLQDVLSGSDAFGALTGRISDYEARFLQRQILAVLAGVFLDNVDNDSGDMTLDIKGASFVPGVTNFSAEALFDAIQTAGDSQGDFTHLAVHSTVLNRMKKQNLIDFIQDSVTGADLATFQGLRVIVDDGLPKSGNICTSYIFAQGALGIGYGNLKKPTAVVEVEDAGNGMGADVLYRRWMNCVHPLGFAWTGATTASGGPDDTTLALAASWNRVCPERKQVKMAQLITREA